MAVLGERYELRDPVGAGGMARVMQARDLVLERDVAVKLLRDDIARDDGARARFLREARTAARLNHPNAVAVFDSGEDDGDPWIVMELIEGEDLAQRIRRTGPLAEGEAVAIADCVLAALAAAHRDGFVHRDVKPSNIMLLDDGSVKLADFGIAKSVQDSGATLTAAGSLMGTARYLAPEQVNGAPATPASDVYAMGIVLYEMLVGRAPFTGTDPLTVAVAHTREPVPDVATVAPDVSTELAGVIAQALAKDPTERFADATQMRRALGEARGTQPLGLPAPPVAATRPHSTTALLPEDIDDEAPTLDSFGAPPPAPRRRPPWLLLALLGAALLTVAALLGLGGATGDGTPAAEQEIGEEVPAADDGELLDDAEADADAEAVPPPQRSGSASGAASGSAGGGKAKGKDNDRGGGSGRGNSGKGKGKKG